MEVREATLDDAERISEIISVLDVEDYGYSDVENIKDFIARGKYFVALDKGRIVGAMALQRIAGSYQIYTIASMEKGAGRAMVEFAIQRCKEDGIPKLWAWSMERYKAKGFYEKMGFGEEFLLKKQWLGQDCYFFGRVVE